MKSYLKRLFYSIKNDFKNTISIAIINTVLLCLLGASITIGIISNNYKNSIENNLEMYVSTHSMISDRKATNQKSYDEYKEGIEQYIDLCHSKADKFDCKYLNISKRLMNSAPIRTVYKDEENFVFYCPSGERMTKQELQEQAVFMYDNQLRLLKNYAHSNPGRLQSVNESDFIYLKKDVVNIIAGRTFTDKEIEEGANVCLIENNTFILTKDGAEYLKLGDKIKLTQLFFEDGEDVVGDEYEFEVIGFYSMDAPMLINGSSYYPIFIPEKKFDSVYTEMISFCNMHNMDISMRNGIAVDDIIFKVDSFDTMRKLITDLKNSNIDLIINTECSGYETVISIVNSVEKTFIYISIVMLFIIELLAIISELSSFKRNQRNLLVMKSLGEGNKDLVIDKILYTSVYMILSILVSIIVVCFSSYKLNSYLNIGLGGIETTGFMSKVLPLLFVSVLLTVIIKIVTFATVLKKNEGE